MTKKLCTVVADEISLEEIRAINEQQLNTVSQNTRNGNERAFSKALDGSKMYLKAQGFIAESEE